MISFFLGVIGTWILCDGIASLYTYTMTDKAKGQTWQADHIFRIWRMVLGIAVGYIGFTLL